MLELHYSHYKSVFYKHFLSDGKSYWRENVPLARPLPRAWLARRMAFWEVESWVETRPPSLSLCGTRRCEARRRTRLLHLFHKTWHCVALRVSTHRSQRRGRFPLRAGGKELAGFVHFNARFDDVTTVSRITNGEFGFSLLEAERRDVDLGDVYRYRCVFSLVCG